MTHAVALLVAGLATLGTYRLLRRPARPAGPAEDPGTGVSVLRRGGPCDRSGAVALDEPDED